MRGGSAAGRRRGLIRLVTLAVLVVVPLALTSPISADPLRRGTTALVSTFPDGRSADGAFPSVSSDGRYVAFESFERLTPDDIDSYVDIYRKDMSTAEMVLASPNVAGVPFSRDNFHPSISGDGNRVAYRSGDCHSFLSQFCSGEYAHVRDLAEGTTILASHPSANPVSTEISRDGRYMALVDEWDAAEDAAGYFYEVNVVDVQTGEFHRLAAVCGPCSLLTSRASISGTGRFLAFESGDPYGEPDVHLYDRDPDGNGAFDEPGKTSKTLVGILPSGDSPYARHPAISEDGRRVAFVGARVVNGAVVDFQVYLRDVPSATTALVSQNSLGIPGSGTPYPWDIVLSASSDGRFVAFATPDPHMALGDDNPQLDVFLRDRQGEKTYLVSVLPDGTQGTGDRIDPSISSDGRFIAFQAARFERYAMDRRVYVRDRQPSCSLLCLEP